MVTLVVTGFGPFPGAPFNFTKTMVDELVLAHPSVQLVKHIYATEYAAVEQDVKTLFQTASPAAIISFGIADFDYIRLESTARNHGTVSNADASGFHWHGPINPNGPDTLPSTLPLDLISQRLTKDGHKVEHSDDAGGYVCNFTFYQTALAAQGTNTKVGFIHVPLIEENDADGDVAVDLRKAVNSIVSLVADWVSARAIAMV